jgi:glycerol uptake facilitator-like aquaporin
VVAPCVGGVLGVTVYDLLIARRKRAGEAA